MQAHFSTRISDIKILLTITLSIIFILDSRRSVFAQRNGQNAKQTSYSIFRAEISLINYGSISFPNLQKNKIIN